MIGVLPAEDMSTVRGALPVLLADEEDLEVVADVERGDEVVLAGQVRPAYLRAAFSARALGFLGKDALLTLRPNLRAEVPKEVPAGAMSSAAHSGLPP
ncbi:hypothetical protein [Kitasatospora brasiliensis]|uniref:hypothetical protein n=1 Tax=Kitasatospora brasiliensis TaxID=3058040 RepID=UPI002931A789|nr:hypothetical protein [Kitasatospora sp. K002]